MSEIAKGKDGEHHCATERGLSSPADRGQPVRDEGQQQPDAERRYDIRCAGRAPRSQNPTSQSAQASVPEEDQCVEPKGIALPAAPGESGCRQQRDARDEVIGRTTERGEPDAAQAHVQAD